MPLGVNCIFHLGKESFAANFVNITRNVFVPKEKHCKVIETVLTLLLIHVTLQHFLPLLTELKI